MTLPCHTHPADFLQPGEDPLWHLGWGAKRAIASCLFSCPRLQQCAQDAVHAGDLDQGKVNAVADGVIQAGVVCRGDMTTRRALRTVANGGTAPSADCCLGCERPFTKVRRLARGMCVSCDSLARRTGGTARAATPRPEPVQKCIACHLPMVARGAERGPGQARRGANGRCHRCDMRLRRRLTAA